MWKGPKIDGVSQSLLNKFLECPYCFFLYAILRLHEPETERDNLVWGDIGHKGLEHLIPSLCLKTASRKMEQYQKERYPEAPSRFLPSIKKMISLYNKKLFRVGTWKTEQIIDRQITIKGIPFRIRGKKDGICYDYPRYQKVLAEHKFKGYIDPPSLAQEIQKDTQCNIYLYSEEDPVEWVIYDLIKIPDTQKYQPDKKHWENESEYIDRMYFGQCGNWKGFPIASNKDQWMHQEIYHIPYEEQQFNWERTIAPLLLRLNEWYEYVTSDNFDMNNPECYGPTFYIHPIRHFNARQTNRFKCGYHGLLTGQLSLEELEPVTSFYSELDENA